MTTLFHLAGIVLVEGERDERNHRQIRSEERRWNEYGGEEYSKFYGLCDVFEGEVS